MLKTISTSIILVAVVALAPAFAQTGTMMDCSDANLSQTTTNIEKMPAGEKKTTAMKELSMAKDMMAKKDMSACKTHLNNAGPGDTMMRDGQAPISR